MEKKYKTEEKKKKSLFGKIVKTILLLILLAVIVFGIIFAYKVYKNGGGLSGVLITALGHDEETKKNLGTINVLILGESGIGDGYKLTDSIMVCSYNPNLQKASILSIPRDTYVGKKDKNSASLNYLASYKMNAVYRNGTNIKETVERVSDLIGIKLDYYVLVDTDAVIKIVDAIGGVKFNVPIDMDYDDYNQNLHIHLKAGEQLIDGNKAEQLLRFRHNNDYTSYPTEYGDNDYGRMRTQREFMQETAKQLLQAKNIFKLRELLDIGFSSIKTNLDLNVLKDYVPYAVEFNTKDIQSGMLPGTSELVNGVWIYSANKTKTKKMVEELFSYKIEEIKNPSEETIKIELLNGTEDTTVIKNVTERLTQKGYLVKKTGTTNKTTTTIFINRTNKSQIEEEELKNIFGIGKNLTKTTTDSDVDFTIIIGEDYTK